MSNIPPTQMIMNLPLGDNDSIKSSDKTSKMTLKVLYCQEHKTLKPN